jgi:aryl-alcohol dehydrogenase-like predicted oxidoreductase
MEITSADDSALLEVRDAQAKSTLAKSESIFDNCGNRYFLAKLFDEGDPVSAALEQECSTLAAWKREARHPGLALQLQCPAIAARPADCSRDFSAAAVFAGAARDRNEILLLPEGRNWAIVYSPMASGLLTGAMPCERATSRPKDDRRRGHADFTEPNVSQYGAGRAHAGDSQPPQALRRRSRNCLDAAPSRRAGAIVGARNTRQAEGVVRARELHLNEIEAFAETAA